jgi:hypothetical protein
VYTNIRKGQRSKENFSLHQVMLAALQNMACINNVTQRLKAGIEHVCPLIIAATE